MSPSVIASDMVLMGNAVSKGEVQVAGEVQGDVQCASLMVEEGATVTGGIVAEDVVVRGKVQGSIRGNRVTLQSSSQVEGDIYHQSLAIEQGAYFEGKSRRAENPVGDAPKLEAPAGVSASPTNGNGAAPTTPRLSGLPTSTTPSGA